MILTFVSSTGFANSVLLATGIILVWYTIETFRLRRLGARQLQQQQQQQPFPILIFPVDRSNTVSMRNIGLGPAINVKIEPIMRIVHEDTLAFTLELENRIIAANETVACAPGFIRNGLPESQDNWFIYLSPWNAEPATKFKIEYSDSLSNKYGYVLSAYKGEVNVEKSPKMI